jgi:hypothetical protein
MNEAVEPLVGFPTKEKRQLETFEKIVQEERERSLKEQANLKREHSCVRPRKRVWDPRT